MGYAQTGAIWLAILACTHVWPCAALMYNAAPTAFDPKWNHQGTTSPRIDQDLFLGIPYAQAPRLYNPLPINNKYDTLLTPPIMGTPAMDSVPTKSWA